ncbi:hypothetical protein AVEN_88859-1 [Araneus ventricosus]|uniref:Uncharacterized protein n=1 Tax=Araneus ventricosus TaxID=182803 RepID=A0A4Y2VZB1_ARAVE|nr:hypothetical protein AVEN_233984-1 [Araneus ventricosus]GBO29678.1 hypothetical protein AVEN_88859-1 [Araneus ventricosus]
MANYITLHSQKQPATVPTDSQLNCLQNSLVPRHLPQATATIMSSSLQGSFWNGLRNFEPLSDDEGNTRAGIPSPNFRTTPTGRCLTPYV